MLLRTNSYLVPPDKRDEHARLMRRFRQTMARLGCDQFEVYEQMGSNWSTGETGRFVQIMRFRDRRHYLSVQNAERADTLAQGMISQFCDLVNLPYQQQEGFFAVGFHRGSLPLWTSSHPSLEQGKNKSTITDAGSDGERPRRRRRAIVEEADDSE